MGTQTRQRTSLPTAETLDDASHMDTIADGSMQDEMEGTKTTDTVADGSLRDDGHTRRGEPCAIIHSPKGFPRDD